MQSDAKTVTQYLDGLPAGRRDALQAIRAVILNNLGTGYEEGMQYGMIGYFVPHSVYPAGYHCNPDQALPFAGLASQKNYMSIYLMCLYGDPEREEWFRTAWEKTGKKLNMGKSCLRFKKIENVPLDVIGEAIRRAPVKKFIKHYESILRVAGKRASRAATRDVAATSVAKKKVSRSTLKRAT